MIAEEVRQKYEPVIGLEVHAQLLTKSKLFCSCSTAFGAPPNTQVCPICLGHPGTLPVTNREAVSLALRMALATGCQIREKSIWARKNYFYPDLPKNYQISQYDRPLCEQGSLTLHLGGETKRIRIHRIHLEEDAGKSKHPEGAGPAQTRIDLNRCGVPLIEIVSEPDLRSAFDAHAYLTALRQLVQYLGVCDGNMEEGSLRCDANVSVRPVGREAFGTRTELKNLNSIRFVQKAIEFEIARQIALLESGGRVQQETLLWDPAAGRTRVMRSKEEAHDYRYFPEPDLPPLIVSRQWIEEVRSELPELPEAKRERFLRGYGLPEADAEVLTQSRALADYFEAVAQKAPEARAAANWIGSELLGQLNRKGLSIEHSPVSADQMAGLLGAQAEGRLSGKLAKFALEEMVETGEDLEAVIQRHGWAVVSDDAALLQLIEQVLRENPENVQAYRSGKEALFRFFVGQVMKLSKGQADPQRVPELLRQALGAPPA